MISRSPVTRARTLRQADGRAWHPRHRELTFQRAWELCWQVWHAEYRLSDRRISFFDFSHALDTQTGDAYMVPANRRRGLARWAKEIRRKARGL